MGLLANVYGFVFFFVHIRAVSRVYFTLQVTTLISRRSANELRTRQNRHQPHSVGSSGFFTRHDSEPERTGLCLDRIVLKWLFSLNFLKINFLRINIFAAQ